VHVYPRSNSCVLVGEVTTELRTVTRSDGSTIQECRLRVPRPSGSGSDSVVLAIRDKAVLGRMLKIKVGSFVYVEGTLISRFWRTSGGAASRLEVEPTRVQRCKLES
jgi:single-strand DNA-binding protein